MAGPFERLVFSLEIARLVNSRQRQEFKKGLRLWEFALWESEALASLLEGALGHDPDQSCWPSHHSLSAVPFVLGHEQLAHFSRCECLWRTSGLQPSGLTSSSHSDLSVLWRVWVAARS